MSLGNNAARVRALDSIFAHLSGPPADGELLVAMRRQTEQYASSEQGRGLALCGQVNVSIGDLEARWFVPPNPIPGHRHVHLHGGGWVAGSIDSHAAFTAELAHLMNAPVLAPRYRLAPEHPFPAGLEDAKRALDYARWHDERGLSQTKRLTLSGDSAGGNLAVAAALSCAAKGEPGPDSLALLCPFLALQLGPSPFTSPTRDPIVSQEAIDLVASLYAPDRAETSSLIEPLHADRHLLARLCPILIQVSAAESLRTQALRFADALWSANIEARLSMYQGMPHVWHVFLESLPDAAAALREVAGFLADEQAPR